MLFILLFILLFYFFNTGIVLVINHQYGKEGREQKKIDTKSLLFDFTFFKQLAQPNFVQQFNEKLNTFVNQLNTSHESGKRT